MGADMRRITTMGQGTVRVYRAVCVYDSIRTCCAQSLALVSLLRTHLLFAVCLVIFLAYIAVETRRNLSSNSYSISDLDTGDLWANLDCVADDL